MNSKRQENKIKRMCRGLGDQAATQIEKRQRNCRKKK